MLKPQNSFPLLDRYREVFPITNETIFAYDGDIYTNNDLPEHLIIHEETHHRQQERYGLEVWVDRYLTDPSFRLEMEIEAYQKQLASISNRRIRFQVMMTSAKTLASPLYGNICTQAEAIKILS